MRKRAVLLTALLVMQGIVFEAAAQESEIEQLRKEIKVLRESNAEKDQKLNAIEKRLDRLDHASTIDQAIADLDNKPGNGQSAASADVWSKPVGGAANLRLIDVSFDVLFSAGGSTAHDDTLQGLQGGDHDPKKRGFTLGQAELSLAGAVDPYFTGEAHMVYKIDALSGDSQVELEEAFLKTLALPWGLQAKAGQYLTEFGRINPTHPHAWLWMDQPVIVTRLFGSDGLRSPGGRLAWLIPTPWFSEIQAGIQNANGETARSFLGNPETTIAARPFFDRNMNGFGELLYSTHWSNSFNLSPTITAQLGASGLYGPNHSSPGGKTWIYGGDVVVKWKPFDHFRGWPFVVLEGEGMHRIYRANAVNFPDGSFFSKETFHDYGLFSQLLYGFYPRWAAGVRYEYINGNNPDGTQLFDPLRAKRQRVSPLLAFYLSEFSRLRLQYNYDKTGQLNRGDAHSVWAGIEFLFGTHPAHKF